MITGHQFCFKGFDGFKKTGPRCSGSRKFQPSKLSSLFWVKKWGLSFSCFWCIFFGLVLSTMRFASILPFSQLSVWPGLSTTSCLKDRLVASNMWRLLYATGLVPHLPHDRWQLAASEVLRNSTVNFWQEVSRQSLSKDIWGRRFDVLWKIDGGWQLVVKSSTATFLEESTAMAKSEKQKIDWSRRRLWKCQIHRSEVYKAVKEKTGFNNVPFQRQKTLLTRVLNDIYFARVCKHGLSICKTWSAWVHL